MGKKLTNGNEQINSSKDSHNQRVEKMTYLGKSKKVTWNKMRRNKSI